MSPTQIHRSGVLGVSLAVVLGVIAVALSPRARAARASPRMARSGPDSPAAAPRWSGVRPGGERWTPRPGRSDALRGDATVATVQERSGPSAPAAGVWNAGGAPPPIPRPAAEDSAGRHPAATARAAGVRRDPGFIRQGEFAVLILEAMRAPRPAWGWEPRAATCLLGARLGCEEPQMIAFLRQYPFGEGIEDPMEGGFSGPPIGPGERPVMPLSGWRIHEFLTEGEMVEVLGRLGIQVFSSRPEELVSWSLARRVLAKFQEQLNPARTQVPPPIGPRLHPPRGNPGPRPAMSPSVP